MSEKVSTAFSFSSSSLVLWSGGFSYPQHPANWKDLPTWMFQKPAVCFKIIPRRLKINRHCDKDECSSRLPSEILMSSDSVLDSKLPQNGKGQDKSLLSLNENLKTALLSNESFCSTAVRSWFLFTPLPKVISRQIGHLPLPRFHRWLHCGPHAYVSLLWHWKKTKTQTDFKEENCSKTRTNRNRGCFLYKCPQFLFFKGGRSYVALFPFNHSSRSQ